MAEGGWQGMLEGNVRVGVWEGRRTCARRKVPASLLLRTSFPSLYVQNQLGDAREESGESPRRSGEGPQARGSARRVDRLRGEGNLERSAGRSEGAGMSAVRLLVEVVTAGESASWTATTRRRPTLSERSTLPARASSIPPGAGLEEEEREVWSEVKTELARSLHVGSGTRRGYLLPKGFVRGWSGWRKSRTVPSGRACGPPLDLAGSAVLLEFETCWPPGEQEGGSIERTEEAG